MKKKSKKLNNKIILPSQKFLKNKNLSNIIYMLKKKLQKMFLKKKYSI